MEITKGMPIHSVVNKAIEMTEEGHRYIVLHQGRPLNNICFNSLKVARNYIKMQYSKRTFKEPEENKFIDTRYGACFEIITLNIR